MSRNFFPVLGAISSFLHLSDAPASYAGKAFSVPRVNVGENALEFIYDPYGVPFLGSVIPGYTSQAHTNTQLYAQRVFCYNNIKVSKMSTIWATAAGATNLKMALYASLAGDSRPDGLPLAETGAIAYNGISFKPHMGNLFAPVSIVAGNCYWLALIVESFGWTQNVLFGGGGDFCQSWTNLYATGFPNISTVGGTTSYGLVIAALT